MCEVLQSIIEWKMDNYISRGILKVKDKRNSFLGIFYRRQIFSLPFITI